MNRTRQGPAQPDPSGSAAGSGPQAPEHTPVSGERRTARAGRIAVSTVLAAALISGSSAAPAAADAPALEGPATLPAPSGGAADSAAADRALGVAQELAEAVARGEISQEQADAFLNRVIARMAAE